MDPDVNPVKGEFETGYLRVSLRQRLLNCENSDLAPVFKRWLPSNQPVLEAGAGVGIWVAWFVKNNWKTVGLEWSETLCAKAGKKIPGAFFTAADMRFMPFTDGAFGSVVALGSIEHLSEGPLRMLSEFRRVLGKDGIAVITVPCNGPLRRVVRSVKSPLRMIKYSPLFRKITGKPFLEGKNLRAALRETVQDWAAEFHYDRSGWHFYEYQFTASQMRAFFQEAGLTVIEESVIMADSGIYNTLRGLAGRYDPVSGRVFLSATGKIIKRFFGTNATGHMLCYVVGKG
ncbi:MAG: class I SAM-dependent methyltransferase [Deltaproteobacteria bacterium]|nr:class I SAM-dependent methyltransferase [Deltaproteobacteria bacterium]